MPDHPIGTENPTMRAEDALRSAYMTATGKHMSHSEACDVLDRLPHFRAAVLPKVEDDREDHIYNDSFEHLEALLAPHVDAGIAECLGDRPGDCDPDHEQAFAYVMLRLVAWTYVHCRNNT